MKVHFYGVGRGQANWEVDLPDRDIRNHIHREVRRRDVLASKEIYIILEEGASDGKITTGDRVVGRFSILKPVLSTECRVERSQLSGFPQQIVAVVVRDGEQESVLSVSVAIGTGDSRAGGSRSQGKVRATITDQSNGKQRTFVIPWKKRAGD